MKTLQVGMGWFPDQAGGLNRFFTGLVQALPSVGVETFSIVNGSEALSRTAPPNVCVYARTKASAATRLLSARKAIVQQLESGQYDLLAAHFAFYTFPALDKLPGIPTVVHFQGPWAMESGVEKASAVNTAFKRLIERAVYRQAGRFIVLSQNFADLLVRRYGIDPSIVRVIPGGIDTQHFDVDISKAEARAHFNLRPEVPTLVAVRRLVHRMGLENLIDAVEQVKRTVPDIQLLIAGKGPLAAALQQRIHEKKLEQQVRLLGFVADADLPLLYRAADINVVPSIALEGFGLTAAEALAAGTPSMVTPVGGLPEVVGGLSENLIFRGNDTASLADGLAEALTDRRAIPQAAACRGYARENFDWTIIAKRVTAVYREL